ncbi:MAG: hypothetical protein LBK42_06840 [Propionibacteriaceae bacterium]|jgi:hypothetical protein|nr:hypothetical protein [Propionibacteriaceae bacterium]
MTQPNLGPEINLPPKPRRRLLVASLLIMILGPVLCLIALVAQASQLSDVHLVQGTEPTPVTLAQNEEYILVSSTLAAARCQVSDPDGRAVTLNTIQQRTAGQNITVSQFRADDSGVYVVSCQLGDSQNLVVASAGFLSGIVVLILLGLGAIVLFVAGGLLLILALVLRSRAKKRYNQAMAEAVNAANQYRQQPPAQAWQPGPQ